MPAPLAISIITPSLNKGIYIRSAIDSVQAQHDAQIEHIIVDGGSSDETIAILKSCPQLKWISEPDRGQAHAMNKGFALAKGDIIGYLNADDYYLPGAFAHILDAFGQGAACVAGRIQVMLADGLYRINDSRVGHLDMLKHWQPDAYPVNSTGYFFRREVLEKVGGFNERNPINMDLEFLLAASQLFPITKINAVLGAFRYAHPGVTRNSMQASDFWRADSFPFIERFLQGLDRDFVRRYQRQRRRGYWLKRTWGRLNRFIDHVAGQDHSRRRRLLTKSRIRLHRLWLWARARAAAPSIPQTRQHENEHT